MGATDISIFKQASALQLQTAEEVDYAIAESQAQSDRLLRTAWISMGAIAAILLGWGSLAPLNKGVMGPGRVSTQSARQVLQSPDGGAVDKVLVREGQRVRAGQPLVLLDRTTPETEYRIVLQNYYDLLGERAMLEAFIGGGPIVWPKEFLDSPKDPAVRRVMASQQRVLDDRRALRAAQQSTINQQVAGLSARLGGLGARSGSLDQQRASINEELTSMEQLYAKGYARKSQVEALRRAKAELAGSGGQTLADIGQTRQSIGEARTTFLQTVTSAREEASARAAAIDGELLQTVDKLNHAKKVLSRTEVKAPVDGVVLTVHAKTIGAILGAGDPVVELVPNGAIEIVGQIRPNDVNGVHVGQKAMVKFPGLNVQTTPQLEGKISYLSADAITDQKSGASYYELRVSLPKNARETLKGEELTPGMPAEIMLDGGARTALQYLLAPVSAAFSHAFRE